MYPDEDLLPISALQHLLFCERQCALIHVERLWAENRLTVEGQQLHQRCHEGPDEQRSGVYVFRGLPIRSLGLGVVGKTDVVEFEPSASPPPKRVSPARLFAHLHCSGTEGWRITPVEYKRGRPKSDASDRVQLCAQTICLEEMLGVRIETGALFYGRTRRRMEVAFDATLRDLVQRSAQRLHELVASGTTPPARREPKCDHCSLVDLCLPVSRPQRGAAAFTDEQFCQHLASPSPPSDPFDFQEALP